VVKTLLKNTWIIACRTFAFVFSATLPASMRLLGYRRLRVGALTFWGTRAFLDMAKESLQFVKERDAELYEAVTKMPVGFWYSPKANTHVGRVFSIGDDYLQWKRDGVLIRILLTYGEYNRIGDALFRPPFTEVQGKEMCWGCFEVLEWLRSNEIAPTFCDAIEDQLFLGQSEGDQ
jgi:hypothetical protein